MNIPTTLSWPSRSGGGGGGGSGSGSSSSISSISSSSSMSSLQTRKKLGILCYYPCTWGMWWCSWLRHCAASQKVAGSIPSGVNGIFH